MNDWLLDILIKPNLRKSDADKIAKQIAAAIKTELSASDLGTIKLDDKKLKSATGNVVTALNSSIRELSQNLKSFAQLMKTAQSQANQAAATTARVAAPAAPPSRPPGRPVRPVTSHDPGYPTQAQGGGPDKSRVSAIKNELKVQSKKSIDNYSTVLKLLVDTPDTIVYAMKAAIPKVQAQAKAGAQKVSQGLSENVTKIIEALRILQVDTGIVANLQAFRQPVKKLADRFRQENKGSPVVNKDFLGKQFSSKTFGSADDPGSGFKQLKSAISALAGVAKKPGSAPEVSVTSLLSEIGKLTSGSGKPGAVKASSAEFGKLQTKTNDIVRDTLRRISLKLEHETKKVGKRIEELRLEGGEGAGKEIKRLSGSLDRKLNRHLEVLRAIDRGSDRFNINLARDTKGQTGRPGLRKEEAGFLAGGNLRSEQRKELDLNKAANQAVKIAQSFKDIPDPVERAQATFRAIWAQAKSGTGQMSKTIALVSETLKSTQVSGLVNRREIQEVVSLLDRYRSQIESFKVQTKGLGGARTSHAVIPRAFDVAEEGGTSKEYLRRVAQIRRQIANDPSIKKGVSIPINIPVETAGGIRNINVEFKKLGNSMSQIIPKAREMNRSLSLKDSVATAFRRVSLWGAAAGITYGAVNAFRQAGRTMTEVETGVINLSKVVRSADSDLEGFAERAVTSAKRIATEYGTSMQEVFKSMRIFAQQGLEMVDVIKLTEATSIAANTTVLDQAKAAEGLTSAIKQFGLEASSSMQIVDAWNEVAKRNAVTELTLVDALKKAGSAARTVGVDFNQLIGLTTAVGEATRQPGKEVGTSLRFIFQRTLRPDTAKALSKVGVATKDLEGNFRGFMAIIGDLAGMWENLSKGQQLAIAQALGGARQYNAVVALMNNYATAVKASEDALSSQGSAQLENTKVMGSTTKVFAQSKASLDALSVSMGKVFLPAAKGIAEAGKTIVDVFAAMPPQIHAILGVLTLATVGLTRFSAQADMVMMGGMGTAGAGAGDGAAGGAVAGLAGGLIGRGREVDVLTQPGLGGLAGIAAVGLGDYAKGAGRELNKLEGALVGVNGRAVKGSEGFSKMGLAIRKMGHNALDGTDTVRIGFRHMNSPIAKAQLAVGLTGKKFLEFGAAAANSVGAVVSSLVGLNSATIAQASAARTAAAANAGWGASLGALAVGIAAIVGGALVLKHIHDVATAQRKSGKETQLALRAELSQRQEVLRSLQQQHSLLGSLATKEKALTQAEVKKDRGRGPGAASPAADLRRYNLELQKVNAASTVAQIEPSSIASFDKFGNAMLKVTGSFERMGSAAVEAQAHLVALTRLKIAKAFALDVKDAEEKLNNLQGALKRTHVVASVEKFGFGAIGGSTGKQYKKEARDVFTQTAKVSALVSKMVAQVKALPKETALFSLENFVKSKAIMDALEVSIRKNNSALTAAGKPAATAVDRLNQLALTVKGFKGVGLTVFETKALYEQQNVAIKSLDTVVANFKKTRQSLKGGELVLIDGDNPFGLTQASTAIDHSGELIVVGFNKVEKRVSKSFTEFVRGIRDKSKVSIIDPAALNKKISESILQVQRTLAGAGAGLLSISGKLNLGVDFDFQLGDVDRLQKVGSNAVASIVAAYQAQREYNASLADFKKSYKDNPAAALSAERSQALNISRAITSALLHMVKFESVLEKVSNSFAKAAHELEKATIADTVERQFSAVYGTIAGFSEKLSVKLPKTSDELSADERFSQTNPELVAGIRAGQRTMERLKSQIVAMEQLSGGDVQKMFESFTNQDQKIFTAAMESLGGDLKGAVMVTHLGSIAKINKQGFSNIYKALTGTAGKKKDKTDTKGLNKAASRAADTYIEAFSKVLDTSQALSQIPVIESPWKKGGFSPGRNVANFLKESFQYKGARQRSAKRSRERERLTGERDAALSVLGIGSGFAGRDKKRQAGGAVVEAELEARRKGTSPISELPALQKAQAPDWINWLRKNVYGKGPVGQDLRKALDFDPVLRQIKESTGIIPNSIKSFDTIIKEFGDVFARSGKEFDPSRDLKQIAESLGKTVSSSLNALQRADLPALTKNPALKRLAAASRALEGIAKGGLGTKDQPVAFAKELVATLTKVIGIAGSVKGGLGTPARQKAEAGKGLAVARAARVAAFEETSRAIGQALKVLKPGAKDAQKYILGLSTALGFVGKRVQSFIYDISKGIDSIRNTRDLGRLTRDVSAPIAGQLKGVSVGQINLGKLKGELSPVERVAKQFSGYFTNIAEQETARTGAVGLFSNMSAQLLKVRKDITGLLTGGEKLANRAGLLKLQSKSEALYRKMRDELVRVNNKMAPFIESITKMVRLEAAKKSIEDIVKALKKTEDLQFDSTSLDKALGRHPLSQVAPQFGEPAGLNKFQQQLFQLQQKSRAGTITGPELSFEKKKIEFQKKEALIQYSQGKENAKLTSETESARRAMGVLWDAQSQGIGGVEGLIQTLKTELESAGESTVNREGVREFRGVPGLFDISKELSKVQTAVKEKDFKQQRDIVMGPMEALQAESNKLQAETKDVILGQAEAIAKAASKGQTKDLTKAVSLSYKSITEEAALVLKSAIGDIGETLVRASAYIRTGTDAQVPKFLENLAQASTGVREFAQAAITASQRLGVKLDKSIKIPAAPKDSGLVPQNKARGGIITGPGGIDTIPARLTRGEYVIPKGIVDKYGAGFFENIRKGNLSGYALGGAVGRGGAHITDVGNLFGISSTLTGGKNHALLSNYGALGKKLKDFIDGIKAGLRGPSSGGITPAYIKTALKEAGMEQLTDISGLATAIASYVSGILFTKGGSISLSKPGRGSRAKIGDSFKIGGGTLTVSSRGRGGGRRSTGGFSPFSGPSQKSESSKPIPGGSFAIVDSSGNILETLEQQHGIPSDFSAFGPSPGEIRDRYGPGPTGFASGGKVSGPSGIDVIPARLTKGEYVIPKSTVDRYGTPFFDAIKSGSISGFVDGGSVGGLQANFDPRPGKIESLIAKSHFPILEALGAGRKFSEMLSFLVTSVSNDAKRLKEASSNYVVGGPAKTSRLPLALAEAHDKESVPDYVKRDTKYNPLGVTSRLPPLALRDFGDDPEPPDLLARRGKIGANNAPTYTGPGSGMYSTKPTGPGSGMYDLTITKTKYLANDFAAVSTVVKDTAKSFTVVKDTITVLGEAKTKITDWNDITTGVKIHKGSPGFATASPGVSTGSDTIGAYTKILSGLGSIERSIKSPGQTVGSLSQARSSLEAQRSGAAELFRRTQPGAPLPAAFKNGQQLQSGGAETRPEDILMPAVRQFATRIDKLQETISHSISLADKPSVSKLPKDIPQTATTAARAESDVNLDKLADRVYNAILEGIRDTEIKLSPDSLKEMEASIVRGAEAMTSAIAQAAPTLSGDKSGGSLGAAVRPEIEQINGRLDALGERITIEKNTIETNLNERFNDVETRIISDVKSEFTPKINHVETQTDSVLAYVRRVESLVHSVNSRGADL